MSKLWGCYLKRARVLLILAAFQCVSFASAPVANVSSAEPLNIDGHSMFMPGVPSFPVVVGDQIATSTGPAIMSFSDGSRLTLAPQSRVKIIGSNAKPTVVLTAGNLEYRLAAGSALTLTDTDPTNQDPNGQAPPQVGRTVVASKTVILIGIFTAIGLAIIIPIVNALHTTPIAPISH